MNRYRFMPFAALLTAFALVIGFCSFQRPAPAQTVALGPSTINFSNSSSANTLCNVTGQNSGVFYATGTMGPVDAQVSTDGATWTATNIATIAGVVQTQPFTPTSGVNYQVAPLVGGCVRIVADSTYGTQAMTVVFRAQGATGAIGQNGGSSTVTCAVPGCTVIQGTTPWVVTTPGPIATLGPLASPSPLPSPGAPYTLPVTNFQYFWNGTAWVPVTNTAPLPVTTPNPPAASGTLTPAVVVGATTITPIVAAAAGQNIYIYYASNVSLGTNTAAFSQLYYGTTSSTPCDTGCTAIGPTTVQIGGTIGLQQPLISASQFASVITGFYPTASGYKLPASQGLYVKSNGTTVNFEAFVDYAQF